MKTKTVWILLGWVCAISFCAPSAHGVNIEFRSDALIRPGDDFEIVRVYDTPPDVTTVHMFGGSLASLQAYDSSIVDIHDGDIWWSIAARDFSTVSIYGGCIDLQSLAVSDSGTLNIYGGDVRIGAPIAEGSSVINIYGYNFSEFPAFSLTGILSDGSPFEIIELTWALEHINLVVIPEPATISLLGLGALWLRKRNNLK